LYDLLLVIEWLVGLLSIAPVLNQPRIARHPLDRVGLYDIMLLLGE
jgi:hypothetical protein